MFRLGAQALARACRSGRSAAWLARLVRDQEVDGSNPFAPTTSKILPSLVLRYFCRINCCRVLWTLVDQLKAKSDALGPLLPKCNIVFELRIKVPDLFGCVAHPKV